MKKNPTMTRQQRPRQQQTITVNPSIRSDIKSSKAYCALKNYSEKEFFEVLNFDPTFIATDQQKYTDRIYVRSMCQIYVAIAQNAPEPITRIKHFKIADLETALLKLFEEYPNNYLNLCKVYGIDPKQRCSRKKQPGDASLDLLILCNWGYIELFLPNVSFIAEKISKKMYSSAEISDLEKAKYAHLFFLFIYGFNAMPYDLSHFAKLLARKKLENADLRRPQKLDLFEQACQEMHQKEKYCIYGAIMLEDAYKVFFSEFPDQSINIDMIKLFMEEILDFSASLIMKQFVNLLDEKENQIFQQLGLIPLQTNVDIRAFKEKIFPVGEWNSDIRLFLTNNTDTFKKAVYNATRKFEKNNFVFGVNVSAYKKPDVFTHVLSGQPYVHIGYLYAHTPITLRISDVNELCMMRIFCKNL